MRERKGDWDADAWMKKYKWTNEGDKDSLNEWLNEWMNGWMNGRTHVVRLLWMKEQSQINAGWLAVNGGRRDGEECTVSVVLAGAWRAYNLACFTQCALVFSLWPNNWLITLHHSALGRPMCVGPLYSYGLLHCVISCQLLSSQCLHEAGGLDFCWFLWYKLRIVSMCHSHYK